MAASCDAAIEAHQDGPAAEGHLPELVDGVRVAPTTGRAYEGQQREIPPPLSSYGFQKLAVEYFAQAAWDQYQLPYTIVRPFNCVGIGEGRALGDDEMLSGNVEAGDEPRRARPGAEGPEGPGPAAHPRRRHQVRHYTYGGDLAAGIVTAMEHPDAPQRGLQPLHRRVHHGAGAGRGDLAQDQGPGRAVPLRAATRRSSTTCSGACPSVDKAKKVLGFEATTTLDEMLDEVIPWIEQRRRRGADLTQRSAPGQHHERHVVAVELGHADRQVGLRRR